MNKIGLILLLLFASVIDRVHAQESLLKNISVEVGWGANYPLKPAEDFLHPTDYIGFQSFYIGGSYEFNEVWGTRISYGFNRLDDSGYSNLGLELHKIMTEATFDFISAVSSNRKMRPPRFDIRLHSGLGLSLGQSTYLRKGYDPSLAFQIGGMPRFEVVKNLYLQIDFVAVINFWQNYDINGIPIHDKVGSYLLSNFGMAYSF